MVVVLDDIIYRLQRSGGISAYWSELSRRLQGSRVYHVDLRLAGENLFGRDVVVSPHSALQPHFDLPLVGRYLPVSTSLKVPHIFHSSYYRYSTNPSARTITTVHDFVYERLRAGLPKLVHQLQKAAAVLHSDGVICVSETTARDFRRFFPDYSGRLSVIHNGVSDVFRPMPEATRRRQILFVGGRTGYKNFGLVVDAAARLSGYRLVIVGGGELTAKEHRRLSDDLGGRFDHYDGVGSEQLNRMYNESHCLVYPSSYEGFGIPIVESMKAGCPVVAGTAPVFREIGGDAVLRLQRLEPEAIVADVKLLESKPLQTELVAKGRRQAELFSWDATAAKTIAFYEEILGGRNATVMRAGMS